MRVALVVVGVVLIAGLFVPGAAAQDRDCDDFDTQEEAQAFFEAEGGPESDPHRLDANDDGIACETLPSGGSGSGEAEALAAEEGKTPSTDTQIVDPGQESLPTTGLPVWFYALVGANVLQVGWGLLLVEDRVRRGPRATSAYWEQRV